MGSRSAPEHDFFGLRKVKIEKKAPVPRIPRDGETALSLRSMDGSVNRDFNTFPIIY